MKTLLVVLWAALLAFLAWEFAAANQLPKKYSKLKPSHIRLVDLVIAGIVILSILYISGS